MIDVKLRIYSIDNRCYIYDVRPFAESAMECCLDVKDFSFFQFANTPRYTFEISTGLIDVNGQEIYEGDIVQFTEELEDGKKRLTKSEVKVNVLYGSRVEKSDISMEHLLFDDIKIVGNIHDKEK